MQIQLFWIQVQVYFHLNIVWILAKNSCLNNENPNNPFLFDMIA